MGHTRSTTGDATVPARLVPAALDFLQAWMAYAAAALLYPLNTAVLQADTMLQLLDSSAGGAVSAYVEAAVGQPLVVWRLWGDALKHTSVACRHNTTLSAQHITLRSHHHTAQPARRCNQCVGADAMAP